MDILFTVIIGVLGLLVGAAVNMLADDLPFEKPLSLPRYADGTRRPLLAWLAIFAFLFGKRAGPDGRRLSWRHVWVEVGMTALFVLMALGYPLSQMAWPFHLQFTFWLLYLAIMAVVAVIDTEHRIIVIVLMYPIYLLALLDSIVTPDPPPGLLDALIGGVVGFIAYFIMFQGGALFSYIVAMARGQRLPEVAFGSGDVWLGIMSGLILGWRLFFFGWMITIFLGGAGAMLYLLSRALVRSRYKAFTPIPYGPYIVLGTVIIMLGRDEVLRLLLRS